ncbi:glycoside hydrolase family 3 C-terminal domain-containing protein, partial [Muriicola sp.]|uniref:glycoside hydrolase family 3 C-terminal domain-containing protein n=1 Tax=Muriicola sp. TaxID=2020856 RepID=UPI003C748283
LRDKFRLGLFDNPYVDERKAALIAGNDEFRIKGKVAQGRSTILLKNDGILPLKEGTKVYAEGIDDISELEKYGYVVDTPEEADVIVKRLWTPFDERDGLIEQFFHQGRLYYTDEELREISKLLAQKPSITIVNMERPAILTEIDAESKALMAEFGTSDEVLADLLFGKRRPEGKLPFELPSSWEAVKNQKEDLPYDSKDPLYPFGHGLSYPHQ